MAVASDVTLASIRRWLAATPASHRPLVVGINGPQGVGKSTLVGALVKQLPRSFAMSLDDFYLPNAEQRALAERNGGNALLRYRGNAGTHSVDLLLDTLKALKQQDGGAVRVPVYNKGAFNGMGDRRPRDEWPAVTLPLDVVLLEGWMLGFDALENDGDVHDPRLQPINKALKDYRAVHEVLDAFVQLVLPDISLVYTFRLQAEREAERRTGHRGLNDEQVRDFIDGFMPAYKQYLGPLIANPPTPHSLCVHLTADRQIHRVVHHDHPI